MDFLTTLIFAIIFAVICAAIASGKKKSVPLALVAGFILGPLALIYYIFSKSGAKQDSSTDSQSR